MRFNGLISVAVSGLAFATHSLAQANNVCDAGCQAVFQAALAQERATWATPDFSADPFFTTPSNASGARPGDILRWQEISAPAMFSNFTSIPGGMSLTRVMYMSEDIEGKPVPATAFVLLPLSLPASGKFQTVAWTHGTAGRSRQCAASNSRALDYGWQGPLILAASGYAVIGPDYAGQGSEIPAGFHYEAGHFHAADTAYAIIATRKILGCKLSDEWVVVGHSEGGMTAWRTNQRLAMPGEERLKKAGKLIGAVSVAPAMSPLDLIPKSFRLAGDRANGPALNAVYFLQSVAKIYPNDIKLPEILTDRALGLLPLLDQGCLRTGAAILANMTTKDVFRTQTWLQNPRLREWMSKYNGDDSRALEAPMLVVQGDNDQLTYIEECKESFDRTCKANPPANVEFRVYPDLGHDGALDAGAPYFLDWVKQRFDAAAPREGCFVTKSEPINSNYQRKGGA
ncbi:secretory lipase [Chaetomium sp. MPI-CAGE-AT-0009]|nr:secretory lipase [Chaetomium sp. MPI-CAGE-AT-0009]